jgi:hypothetical protein
MPDLTPEAIAALQEHELAALTGDDEGTIPVPLTVLQELQARIAHLESQEATRAQLRRERDAAVAALDDVRLRNATVPLVIGGPQGVHPDELDLVAGTSPHQLLANLEALIGRSTAPFPTPLVLIPCPLWPRALQPPERPFHLDRAGNPAVDRDGNKIPNLQVGRVNILESRLSLPIRIASTTVPVSLSGMAILSVNRFDGLHPDAVLARIDRRAATLSFSTGQSPLDAIPDSGTGTFIPSNPTHGT